MKDVYLRDLAEAIKTYLGEKVESVEKCMHCGFCNSVCPTSSLSSAYKETRTSRGRAILFQAVLRGTVPGNLDLFSEKTRKELDYCMQCGLCETVCPVSVPLQLLVGVYKEVYRKVKGESPLDYLLRNYQALESLALNAPQLYNAFVESSVLRDAAEAAFGLSRKAALPKAAGRSPRISDSGELLLLTDLFTWAHEPETIDDAIGLLEKIGVRAETYGPIDSHIVLLESGYLDALVEEAGKLVENVLGKAGDRPIIALSPAVYHMIKKVYPVVLRDEKAARLASITTDMFTVYLSRARRGTGESRGEIVYHDSCLVKSSGLAGKARQALTAAGYKISRIMSRCCGMGGAWSLKKSVEELSEELAERFLDEASSLPEGTTLVSDSEACRLRIRSLLGSKVEVTSTIHLLKSSL